MPPKLTILLVEDEPAVAENIRYALETEGFDTHWETTGQAGLERLEADRFDLVVLDVGLPDGSGFDVCRELRKTSSVPVLFLTARQDEVDRVVGLELGADDYVTKPFSPRELTARIRAILRRSNAHHTPELAIQTVGPFVLDPDRKCISYFGQPLDLRRYEYRLLAVFLERPGRVMSRQELMDAAWEEPDASMERTVDAHIKSLRKKLKAVRDDADPLITHRGMGYSLRDAW